MSLDATALLERRRLRRRVSFWRIAALFLAARGGQPRLDVSFEAHGSRDLAAFGNYWSGSTRACATIRTGAAGDAHHATRAATAARLDTSSARCTCSPERRRRAR